MGLKLDLNNKIRYNKISNTIKAKYKVSKSEHVFCFYNISINKANHLPDKKINYKINKSER